MTHHAEWKKELNESQLAAVEHISGPSLIIAGAGSGKTRTLTYKVLNLLQNGVHPERIMLLTFTNKAAAEMVHRVSELVGEKKARNIYAGTFHKIGNIFLHRHGQAVGVESDYTILDREDSLDVMEEAMKGFSLPADEEKEFPGKKVLAGILGLAKNKNISPANILASDFEKFLEFEEVILKIFAKYEELKKKFKGIDFDDMLNLWLKLLWNEETSKRIRGQFDHVLIDEYQDTNRIQADIADIMAKEKRNLTVVGDDSQSIYSFRGADFGNIIGFAERYPDSAVFKLEVNYRSTKAILDLANASITNNTLQYEKKLRPWKDNRGHMPQAKAFGNVYGQAEGVVLEIRNLIDNGMDPHDIAVLYRSHYHSMELQMELTRRRLDFTVHSGLKFFELAHIKTLVSFLRASCNLQDFVSWRRLLHIIPGIGPKTSDKVLSGISHYKELNDIPFDKILPLVPNKSRESSKDLFVIFQNILKKASSAPGDAVDEIIQSPFFNTYLVKNFPDFRDRLDDCRQFQSFVKGFDSLGALLDELSLITSGEDYYNGKKGIVLTSIHQAKGLEWKAVFIIWLCEGKFPVFKSANADTELEEERRLFYVAVTRAKERLYLTYPLVDTRNQYGAERFLKRSRFLSEIPYGLYYEDRMG